MTPSSAPAPAPSVVEYKSPPQSTGSPSSSSSSPATPTSGYQWCTVEGLETMQVRKLQEIHDKGLFWKDPRRKAAKRNYNSYVRGSSSSGSSGSGSSGCGNTNNDNNNSGLMIRLEHGGVVAGDGNCLFTSIGKVVGLEGENAVRLMRTKAIRQFLNGYYSSRIAERAKIDKMIRNMYLPDIKKGWLVNFIQECKMLVWKKDRAAIDEEIEDLVITLGVDRWKVAKFVYEERAISVDDARAWAKYMLVEGSPEDEFDIVTFQFTEEGLYNIEENRNGIAVAFGDDIAIKSLATYYGREIYVVQTHGMDGSTDEESSVFFLPHSPIGRIRGPPIFLFMKGTGWSASGGDHFDPLIATVIPGASPETAAAVL